MVNWNKQIGDRVEKGEALLTVESDKATLDVESFSSGYLRKILYAEQSSVKIGEVIALLADGLGELPSPHEGDGVRLLFGLGVEQRALNSGRSTR